MADQLITLRPNRGDEIEVDGTTYHLGLEPDWGESTVDSSLLEGPDITGAVAGTRRLTTRERTLTIQVRADDGETYLAAAEALVACVSNIQRYGGTIVRQLELGSAGLSEALECEILEASLSEAEDGWLEANRLHGEVVLNLTTQPQWLADWEQVASVSASTASLIECPVDALRGNLPGPGRIVFTDNASTARRFVELGGAFENYVAGQQTEFRAGASGGDFDLTGADGSAVTTAVTDRIGTHTISVSPILPVWRTVAYVSDMDHSGTSRIRTRVLCEADEVTVWQRVLWRAGTTGAWNELETVEVPTGGWWDLDMGTISHYDETDTIDIRIDVRASAVDNTNTYRLNVATVTSTDLYSLVRGRAVTVPAAGIGGYEAVTDEADGTALSGGTTLVGSHVWSTAGAATGFTVAGEAYRRQNVADANPQSGHHALMGTAVYSTVTAQLGFYVTHEDAAKQTRTMIGPLVRYVDTNNWAAAVLQIRRRNDGKYERYVSLVKRVSGTFSYVKTIKASKTSIGGGVTASFGDGFGAIQVSVKTDGSYEVMTGPDQYNLSATDLAFKGTDSDFATSAALDDGKAGVYSSAEDADSAAYWYEVAVYADADTSTYVDVIRDGGTGEITYAQAFSADADGSDPQPVSSAEGRRIWIPPGISGQLTAKVRTSDSEVEVDEGHSNSTDLDVYHRPAFATLSDSLE